MNVILNRPRKFDPVVSWRQIIALPVPNLLPQNIIDMNLDIGWSIQGKRNHRRRVEWIGEILLQLKMGQGGCQIMVIDHCGNNKGLVKIVDDLSPMELRRADIILQFHVDK